MTGGSGSAAATARRRRIEEEEMTNYSNEDLANDWEFKIVRSLTAAFRNPATLEKLRQEEAQAGWVMVEKFDNARVRFKRPIRAQENDSRLPQGVDPYRTYYGMGNPTFSLAILFVVFGFIRIGVFNRFGYSDPVFDKCFALTSIDAPSSQRDNAEFEVSFILCGPRLGMKQGKNQVVPRRTRERMIANHVTFPGFLSLQRPGLTDIEG